MSQEEFVNWLKKYLDHCEKDQVALIKEKLSLVSVKSSNNYIDILDNNKTSISNNNFNWTSIDNNTSIT